MKLIEEIVHAYMTHRGHFHEVGRIGIEVYAAYVLEKMIDHFHEQIGKLLKKGLKHLAGKWSELQDYEMLFIKRRAQLIARSVRNRLARLFHKKPLKSAQNQ